MRDYYQGTEQPESPEKPNGDRESHLILQASGKAGKAPADFPDS